MVNKVEFAYCAASLILVVISGFLLILLAGMNAKDRRFYLKPFLALIMFFWFVVIAGFFMLR